MLASYLLAILQECIPSTHKPVSHPYTSYDIQISICFSFFTIWLFMKHFPQIWLHIPHHENHPTREPHMPQFRSLSLTNLAIPWVSEECWVSLREHISFLYSSSIPWSITWAEKKFCLCLKFSFSSLEFYLFICLSSFVQHVSQAMQSLLSSYDLSGP